MIQIHIGNNNKGKLIGPIKKIEKIKKKFKVRNPNAYFIRLKGNVDPGWDGMINYITDSDYFKIGLLPSIYNYIKDNLNTKVEIVDDRPGFSNIKPKYPNKIGDLKPRPYQENAIKKVIFNKIEGVNFPIGVLNMATNAGKTMIMAGIYLSYKRKIPAVVLINDGDLFEQFKREIPELLGEKVGFVRGKEQNWENFTVIMVQTVSRNISKYRKKLHNFGMVLVDEADLGTSKSYTSILNNCYNAQIRIGLSGTIYMSKLKKHLPKQQNLRSYFGDELYKISKKEMQDRGYSTRIIIRLVRGNTKVLPGLKDNRDWKHEYDKLITYNEDRILTIVDRIRWNAKIDRIPILVIGQFHAHIELMYSVINKNLGKKYRIAYVHGGVNSKTRIKILENFRVGKIDILISSFIIKRGKNLPLTKLLINGAGSDSQATVLQLMGRIERKDKTKNKAYMEDLMDQGKYISRHSKHRAMYYKKEGLKVIENYKR